jgi:hypothetical protein
MEGNFKLPLIGPGPKILSGSIRPLQDASKNFDSF